MFGAIDGSSNDMAAQERLMLDASDKP